MNQLIDLISKEQMLITAVEFFEDSMSITYQEKRHVNDRAIKTQQVQFAIDSKKLEEQYMALQSDLIDIVEDNERDLIDNPSD